MRRRRHKRGSSVFGWALLCSLALHLLLGFPAKRWVERFLASKPKVDRPVRVVRLSPQQWQQNMAVNDQSRRNPLLDTKPNKGAAGAVSAREEAQREEEKKKKKVEDKLTGQVVEVPPTRDDSPNPDAKYLSKYNTHVEKETVARPDARNSKLRRVTNELQTTQRNESRDPNSIKTMGLSVKGDGLEADREGSKGESEFSLQVPDILKRDELKLDLGVGPGKGLANRDASEALKGNSDRFDLRLGSSADGAMPGQAGGKKGDKNGKEGSLPTLAALVPNFGTLARISGSPSRDHVEGLPEGDGTFLNAKEFKYATFFYRVRDSVADYWEDLAAREYRRRDPTGHIYGIRDRSTLLSIRLDREGALDDIRVEQTSGVDFLDNVAVEAFRKAQPFPNPPEGIMDEDGRIRFNFQFIITMNARRGLNIFRSYR